MGEEKKEYTKEIEIHNKWVLMSVITVIGIFLIYLTLSFGGAVPTNYNIVDLISGGNNKATQTPESGEAQIPKLTKFNAEIMIWNIPNQVNVTQNPHTSWQISIKVVKGSITNLTIELLYSPIDNVTVNLTSLDSHWSINNYSITYNGVLSAGQMVSFYIHINKVGNITSSQVGTITYIVENPMTVIDSTNGLQTILVS